MITTGPTAPLAALLLLAACGGGADATDSATADVATGSEDDGAFHVDDVVPVVEYGFVPYEVPTGTGERHAHGWVVENTSDQVALGVRVEVVFYDDTGAEIEELRDREEFSAVPPGTQVGGGDDRPAVTGRIAADMGVAVTYLAALDDDAARPYRELTAGEPVTVPERSTSQRTTWAVTLTNAYDEPLSPVVHHILRSPDGFLLGGVAERPVASSVPAGATATAEFAYDLTIPELAEAVPEVYVDPGLPWPEVTDPV